MSIARKLAWNTGVQLLGKAVSTVFGVIIVGLMTRHLGQEGFGIYSTANAFLQMFALLIDLGLNVTLVALLGEHAGDDAYERRCSSAIFTLRFLMAALIFGVVAPLIGFLLPYPLELRLAIIALSGSFFFPVLNQIVIGVQQRHMRMGSSAVAENIGRVVLLAGLLLARELSWGLVAVMLFVSIGSALNFFYNFSQARKFGDFHWNIDVAFWKMALARSWPVGLSILFGLVYFKADTLVLERVRPLAEVGIYGAAYRVLEILITVPFMYAGVLLPLLSKARSAKALDQFGTLMARSLDVMAVLTAPLIAGVWILGPDIMAIVAGDEFRASGEVLKILILAIGVIYFNTVFSHAIVALDAQRKMLPVYIVVSLLTLCGYVLLIPTYGMWAAAWLTLLSETAVGAGSLYFSFRMAPYRFALRPSLAAIGSAALMSGVILALPTLPLLARIGIGAVTYGASLIALGGIKHETLRELLAIKNTA